MAGVASNNNAQKIQQLKRDLSNCKQLNLTINAYYTKINTLWDQLSPYEIIPTCESCESRFRKRLEEEKLHQFLMGVSDTLFSDVRSALLSMDPLPSIVEAYNTLLREEDVDSPLLNLPNEILQEILLRLPSKKLFCLTSVSRLLKSAVMDPVLATKYMHRDEENNSLSYYSRAPGNFRGLLYPLPSDFCRRRFEYSPRFENKDMFVCHADCKLDEKIDKRSRILASSNGLILYQFKSSTILFISDQTALKLRVQNPVTNQSIGLRFIRIPAQTRWTCGFATRAWVDEDGPYTSYRVVLMLLPKGADSATIKIFSSHDDTRSWVEVGSNLPCPKVVYDNYFLGPDFCYKGILHWIDGCNRTVVTYDPYAINRDGFGEIRLPDNPGGNGKVMNLIRLGQEELVECCEVVCLGPDKMNQLVVWRLVDYEKGEWVEVQRSFVSRNCGSEKDGEMLRRCRQVVAPDPWDLDRGFLYMYATEISVNVIDLLRGKKETICSPKCSISLHPIVEVPLLHFVFCPWYSVRLVDPATNK